MTSTAAEYAGCHPTDALAREGCAAEAKFWDEARKAQAKGLREDARTFARRALASRKEAEAHMKATPVY